MGNTANRKLVAGHPDQNPLINVLIILTKTSQAGEKYTIQRDYSQPGNAKAVKALINVYKAITYNLHKVCFMRKCYQIFDLEM